MRLLCLLLPLFFLFMGCAPRAVPPDPVRIAATGAVVSDWLERRSAMIRRFPPNQTGSDEDRREIATRLINEHIQKREELNMPYNNNSILVREDDLNSLINWPILNARFELENQAVLRQRELNAQIANFDGRQVSPTEIARLAGLRVDTETPQLRGDERRVALAAREAQIRQSVEERRRNAANTAINRREIELSRLAASNLADMPREILRVAEENLADARSPFDTRPNWRPDQASLRQEEVRLRSAVSQRMEINMRMAQANAQAAANVAHRETVMQQCRVQAAMAGASVPSPYMGRGLGGAFASGIAGAMRSAEMEASVLQTCLRASGF